MLQTKTTMYYLTKHTGFPCMCTLASRDALLGFLSWCFALLYLKNLCTLGNLNPEFDYLFFVSKESTVVDF